MGQERTKNVFIVCCVAMAMLTASMQGTEMIVCAEEYEYDDLNRIIRVTYEDGGTVEYVYDSNGNIIETIVGADVSANSSDEQEADARNNKDAGNSAEVTGVTLPDKPNQPTVLADAAETPKSAEPAEPVESGQTEQSESTPKVLAAISLLVGGLGTAYCIYRKSGKWRKVK